MTQARVTYSLEENFCVQAVPLTRELREEEQIKTEEEMPKVGSENVLIRMYT